jgi:hypothetical protein
MEEDIKIVHFTGWHGTDESDAEEILRTNFEVSQGEDHWLGDGVYFFGEGVGNPSLLASSWAKSEAHKKKYLRFAVLKADIAVNDTAVLDLCQAKGIELFDKHRAYVLRQIRRSHRGFRLPDKAYCDSKVFEHIKQVADLEVIVMNFYVQFEENRIQRIFSRIPNCTFLCVSNPKDNINQDSINIVDRGAI